MSFFGDLFNKVKSFLAPFVKKEAQDALAEFEAFAKQFMPVAIRIVAQVALGGGTPSEKLGAATSALTAELIKEGIPAGQAAVQTLIQNALIVVKLNKGQAVIGV